MEDRNEATEARIAALEARLAGTNPDRKQQQIAALASWVNKQTDHFAAFQAFPELENAEFSSGEIVAWFEKWRAEGKLRRSQALSVDGKTYYLRTEKWDL